MPVCVIFESILVRALLVSNKNCDLREAQHRKSAIHGLPVTLRMLRAKSGKSTGKSDWLRVQTIGPEVPILSTERGLLR